MRVTGGRLAGRRLRVPRAGVRPTADRVRESLFARLGDLSGCRVLDLFAGSGALGIEALSRGAASALFVDRAAPSLAAVRANLASLGLEAVGRVRRGGVAAVLRRAGAAGERFELVLADPPYGPEEATRLVEAVATSGVLAPGAMLVVEASRRHPPGDVAGLVRIDERICGDALIVRFERGEPADHARREAAARGRMEAE